MAIRKSSNTGIPFGNSAGRPANPVLGQPYFNGQVGRLEIYTNLGWQNIVQETPGVASASGSYLQSNNQGVFAISGTNFTENAIAYAVGSNGLEYAATSTVFNSLVQLTATFSNLNPAYEPFGIKVQNPSNLFGLLPNAFYINESPVWQFTSGSLGTFDESTSVNISSLAIDPEGSSLTFAIFSGSLPSGLTLNTSTGTITGTLAALTSAANQTSSFTVSVTDSANATLTRSFTITVNNKVSWSTTAGSLGTLSYSQYQNYSLQLSALSPGNSLTYSIVSGSLPTGFSLSNTGLISGTATEPGSQTTYNFTVRADDGYIYSDREFSYTLNTSIMSTFNYTGSTQNWVAPAGISAVYIKIWGAGGYGGAEGGYTTGQFSVTPGRSYSVYVGNTGNGSNNATGGWPGGGNGVQGGNGGWGKGGGGYSAIYDTVASQYVAIAGGGGGAGSGTSYSGNGGGTNGGNVVTGWGTMYGGSQTAGGAAGASIDRGGNPGGYLYGGTGNSGGNSDWGGGGGGGSGYYGGASGITGGGANTGGAGGSGYVNLTYSSTATTTNGVGTDSERGTAGNASTAGKVIIKY